MGGLEFMMHLVASESIADLFKNSPVFYKDLFRVPWLSTLTPRQSRAASTRVSRTESVEYGGPAKVWAARNSTHSAEGPDRYTSVPGPVPARHPRTPRPRTDRRSPPPPLSRSRC